MKQLTQTSQIKTFCTFFGAAKLPGNQRSARSIKTGGIGWWGERRMGSG
jgi:hypothetical protein